MRKLHNLIALALFAFAAPLAAAPCAGFNDVEDTSPFCPSVEWMKNRAITVGCDVNLFCPNASLTRVATSAFLQRTGGTLSPTVLAQESSTGALDLDLAPVVCQTANIAIAGYPRMAVLDGMLTASAAAAVDVAAALVKSADGGANWTPVTSGTSAAFVPAGSWSNVAAIGSLDLQVGDTVRFGIAVSRVDAGATDLADGRCQLRVSLNNRNGSASPY